MILDFERVSCMQLEGVTEPTTWMESFSGDPRAGKIVRYLSSRLEKMRVLKKLSTSREI